MDRADRRCALLAGAALAGLFFISAAEAQEGPFVYVASTGGWTKFIDSVTGVPGGVTIPGGISTDVAVRGDQSFIYIADVGNNAVSVVETASHSIVATIPVGAQPEGIAISPDGRTVYAVNFSGNSISVIDTATNSVSATIATGFAPHHPAVSPDGTRLYVPVSGANSLLVIDTASNTAVTSIAIGSQPTLAAVSTDGSRVYVANFNGNSVSVIDAATNTVISTIGVGGNPQGMTVSPDGTRLYVANVTGSTISVIDTASGTVTSTFAGLSSPRQLAVSPDGTRLYVASSSSTDVTVIDAATGTIVDQIPMGGTAWGTGMCANGNALLAAGNTFTARTGGALLCTGPAGAVFTGGTLQVAGAAIASAVPMMLSAAGGTVDTNGNTATLSGAITGPGGLSKIGAGALVLTGASTYAGPTVVAAGGLVVNGSITSAVTVSPGAFLGGSGSVGSTTIGGTLAPGNSIGTLTVQGDLTFQPGATYAVEIEPGGTSDLTRVTGAATLDGTVAVAKAPGAYLPGTRYTILTAAGGVNGRFAGLTQDLPFIDLLLAYDPGNVYLDIARNAVAFPAVGATPNQRAAAAGAEALGPGNAVHDAIVQQTGAAGARTAFDALSGEMHASAAGVLIEESRFLRNAATDRLRSAFAAVGAPGMPVMAFAGPGGASRTNPLLSGRNADPAHAASGRFALWGQGFGSWGHASGDGNAARLSRSSAGFVLGADAGFLDTWRVGVLGGYSRTSFDAKPRISSGTSDNYHLGIYGGGQWGALGLRTGAGYTWHRIDTSRAIVFPGFADAAQADYDAGTAQAFGELGYGVRMGVLSFEPFAGLAYVHLDRDGFAERGGAAALSGLGQDSGVTFSTLGLRLATEFLLGSLDATARGTLGWRHAFGDVAPDAALAFASGQAFTVAGTPIARNALLLEAGLDVNLTEAVAIGLSYTGQIARDAIDQGVKGTITARF